MALPKKLRDSTRFALGSVFLVANAFIWYFLAARILEVIINKVATNYYEILIMWSLHFTTLTLSTIVGVSLMQRIGRKKLFVVWTLMGVISPLALLALDFAQTPIALLVSLLFGISLGLGMPNCMEYFRRLTSTENRGRYGGLVMFISGLGLFLLGITNIMSIEVSALILAVWRLFNLTVLLLPKSTIEDYEKRGTVSYSFVFSQRSFILYLIPWIMFSLITYLTTPLQSEFVGKSTVEFLIVIENVFIGVFAVVGGFLLDSLGRKRLAILGFVLLGAGYSVLGIFSKPLISWYFYTVVDGIAWGILFVIFVVTIWGDLSYNMSSDKHYAIGVLPFFISKFLQLTIGNELAAAIPMSAIFSFTALFLFIAVLPLFYAPETLPEKTMKDRELKSYIEKAKKTKEKYA